MLGSSQKSFTLVELLVVIAIVGLVVSMVVLGISGAQAKARDAERKAEVDAIRKVLSFYYIEHGKYPQKAVWASLETNPTLDTGTTTFFQAIDNWLPDVPGDPLYPQEKESGEPYSYQYKTDNDASEYKIYVEMETGAYATYVAHSSGGGGITSPGGEEWTCGDNLTFTYSGSSVTYGTVIGQNDTCWLDRNLGASQQATAHNDYLAYGDLFQWGRLDDGHQTILWTSSSGSDGAEQSSETSTNSSGDVPGHDDFILEGSSPNDWRVPQNNNLWQGVSGTNNPCPDGWRIPTEAELDTERQSWSENNIAGAYGSSLKFVITGIRNGFDGSLFLTGDYGYYWNSSVYATEGGYLYFHSSNASVDSTYRANGLPIRCLKD